MVQWYGIQRSVDKVITDFVSDDSQAFKTPPAGSSLVGPFATRELALAVLLPTQVTFQQSQIAQLRAKPSASWTLTDVADWLKVSQ